MSGTAQPAASLPDDMRRRPTVTALLNACDSGEQLFAVVDSGACTLYFILKALVYVYTRVDIRYTLVDIYCTKQFCSTFTIL